MRIVTRVLFSLARLSGGVSSLLHYVGASTLRLGDMKQGIRESWQGFNSEEASITAGLMPWEEDLVQRFIAPLASVLVVGCGSGRDLLSLVQRGHRVTGVDPASGALRTAQRVLRDRHLQADLIDGFFEDVQLSGHFDVVMFSYYSYCYIPESARRIRVLRKAAAHLTRGGRILISYPRMPRPRLLMIRLARLVGTLCRSDWRLEPGDFVVPERSGNRLFYSYAHAFQPAELEEEAAAAGLRTACRLDPPGDAAVVLEPAEVQPRDSHGMTNERLGSSSADTSSAIA
jgi:SAM-dependent methyltransferase